MAKDKIKISRNEVDRSPSLYANPADPRSYTIDPAELRYGSIVIRPQFSFGGIVGGNGGEDDPGDGDTNISKYLPQLGDISIVSEELDYSTSPVTIKLKLKIIDRTGAVITGIKGRVPK